MTMATDLKHRSNSHNKNSSSVPWQERARPSFLGWGCPSLADLALINVANVSFCGDRTGHQGGQEMSVATGIQENQPKVAFPTGPGQVGEHCRGRPGQSGLPHKYLWGAAVRWRMQETGDSPGRRLLVHRMSLLSQ